MNMEQYLIGQLTESSLLDPIINFEIIIEDSPKHAKIKYAKKHNISKHYALIVAYHFDYYFDLRDVWSITGSRYTTNEIFILTYKKMNELNLKLTKTTEDFYKTHIL